MNDHRGEPLFDFACSREFRCFDAWEMDGTILTPLEPDHRLGMLEERLALLEELPPNIRRGELQQIKSEVKHLSNKVMELRAKKARKDDYY